MLHQTIGDQEILPVDLGLLDCVETHLQLFIGVHVKTIALWASVHGQEAQTFQRSPALSCHPDSLAYPFS